MQSCPPTPSPAETRVRVALPSSLAEVSALLLAGQISQPLSVSWLQTALLQVLGVQKDLRSGLKLRLEDGQQTTQMGARQNFLVT